MADRVRYLLSHAACALIGHRWRSTSRHGIEVCTRIACRGRTLRGDAHLLGDTDSEVTR